MDPISKLLAKLAPRERQRLKDALKRVERQELRGLDVKKFEGFDDLYRVRIGSFRIHLRRTPTSIFYAINVERRTTTTYRKRR